MFSTTSAVIATDRDLPAGSFVPYTVSSSKHPRASVPFGFEHFVAFRYLRGAQGREEGRRFLRLVTWVAIGGVAVGVATLLLALSIVHGFSREIEEKIVGFGAHVQVESFQDEPLEEAGRLQRRIMAIDHVRRVTPVVTEFALLRKTAEEIDGVALWGTDGLPPYLVERLVAGRSSFSADAEGRPGVVVGQQLARLLDLSIGDRVTAFSMRGLDTPSAASAGRARPRVKQFYVAGIFETSLANFDELYVFTDIGAARDLLSYGVDEVTRFDVTADRIDAIPEVALAVEERLGFPIMARTIYEVYSGLFAWINLQESIIPLVIGVIILVAAFNIVGTLLMIILEKTREVGVLASMGASRKRLRRLFLWLGALIGLVGTAGGEVLALVLALLQQRFQIIPLPAEAYYMEYAPIELSVVDFVLVAVVSLVLCALSAYVPARVASRIEPVRVIRFQ